MLPTQRNSTARRNPTVPHTASQRGYFLIHTAQRERAPFVRVNLWILSTKRMKELFLFIKLVPPSILPLVICFHSVRSSRHAEMAQAPELDARGPDALYIYTHSFLYFPPPSSRVSTISSARCPPPPPPPRYITFPRSHVHPRARPRVYVQLYG